MATVLYPARGIPATDLYDSATGKSLIAEKLVDVSRECLGVSRVLFLFTRAVRGRIVQIIEPYVGEEVVGSRIHFFVDEDMGESDPSFVHRAGMLGLTAPALRDLILTHVPD